MRYEYQAVFMRHKHSEMGMPGSWRIIETFPCADGQRTRILDKEWRSEEEANNFIVHLERIVTEDLRRHSIDAWHSAMQPIFERLSKIANANIYDILATWDKAGRTFEISRVAKECLTLFNTILNPQPAAPPMPWEVPGPLTKPWTPSAPFPTAPAPDAVHEPRSPAAPYLNIEASRWDVPEGWRVVSCFYSQSDDTFTVTLEKPQTVGSVAKSAKGKGSTIYSAFFKAVANVR